MSLAEIEAELPSLSKEELQKLVDKLQRAKGENVPTGRDLAQWAEEREYLPDDEAEAFVRDIEEGRRLMSRPPQVREWET